MIYRKKILILGASGMLGHIVFLKLFNNKKFSTFGTVRKKNIFKLKKINKNIIYLNLKDLKKLEITISKLEPDFIINCAGVIKQKINSSKNKDIYLINSILPNFINSISNKYNFKFIQISTDCVFNGKKGKYTEKDKRNASDIYGLSKKIGEVDSENCITLRTSIIGHELNSSKSLLEWFLSQPSEICGYKKAFFSGLTTTELSRILEKTISKKNISGIFNLSSKRISKYHLLLKLNNIYNKQIKIIPSNKIAIDRSLNGSKFKMKFRIKVNSWEKMLKNMKNFYIKNKVIYEKF